MMAWVVGKPLSMVLRNVADVERERNIDTSDFGEGGDTVPNECRESVCAVVVD